MEYVPVTDDNRAQVNAFLADRWFSTDIVIRGRTVDLSMAQGIAAMEQGSLAGLVTYIRSGGTMEITSLDSVTENRGVGTGLVAWVLGLAAAAGCRRVIVVTTNDNIRAIRFYQKRGFDMSRFFHNSLNVSRRLKPQIPLLGSDGIPLRHEIEFEKMIEITPKSRKSYERSGGL